MLKKITLITLLLLIGVKVAYGGTGVDPECPIDNCDTLPLVYWEENGDLYFYIEDEGLTSYTVFSLEPIDFGQVTLNHWVIIEDNSQGDHVIYLESVLNNGIGDWLFDDTTNQFLADYMKLSEAFLTYMPIVKN